jgi:hypothetical protein
MTPDSITSATGETPLKSLMTFLVQILPIPKKNKLAIYNGGGQPKPFL